MTVIVAQIPDPFSLTTKKSKSSDTKVTKSFTTSLPMGLFVEAIIEGRWFDDLVILPASALLNNNLVAIIDQKNQLRFRTVEVLRRQRDQVIISAGLNAGERVFVSGLHHPIEGMRRT